MTLQAWLHSNFTLYFLVPFLVLLLLTIRKARRLRSITPVLVLVLMWLVAFLITGILWSIGALS